MIETGSPYRPLDLKVRDDLQIVEQVYRGQKFWVVGDSLALEYYRLNEQEYALLSWLDGTRSLEDLKELFEATFSPHQVSHREIETYVIDFHKKSLLASFTHDQGRHLRRMGGRKRLKKAWNNAKSLLAFRWPGINPDRVFRAVTPLFGWLFSKWMVGINLLVMLSALIWFFTHFSEVQERLPSAAMFFSGQNWLYLVLVIMGMKIVHEFAHGIVFTKYGGRCHELGVMLLVFVPTLYVNTSDSWRFPSKWRRAAVAAAGIYIELLLAALAMFAWWYSKPGPFQFLCLNVMILGAISSVLFNGNPLLKFDGYYLLSDLIEIPNLQQRSARFIRDRFLLYGLGVREGDDERFSTPRTKTWLVGYALAAYAFRFVLVYAIAFIVIRFFRPVGLEEFAKMFSFVIMSLLVIVPLLAIAKYFATPGQTKQIKRRNATVTAAIAVLLLATFFVVPFPDSVRCNFIVEPGNAMTVYVPHDAILKEVYVQPRQTVSAGEPIALLRNIDVELELADLEGRIQKMDREETMLRLARFESKRDVPRSMNLRTERTTIEKRLTELREIQSSMLLVAPRDGVIVPVRREVAPSEDADDLDRWHGWTLDNENANASFVRGQPMFQVGDFERPTARLFIDQSDVRFVLPKQDVQLLLDSDADEPITSKIESISESNAEIVHAGVTHEHGGHIEATPQKTADHRDLAVSTKPADATYEAIAYLDEVERPMPAGLRGEARISIGHRTLAGRLHRFLNQTFRFDL